MKCEERHKNNWKWCWETKTKTKKPPKSERKEKRSEEEEERIDWSWKAHWKAELVLPTHKTMLHSVLWAENFSFGVGLFMYVRRLYQVDSNAYSSSQLHQFLVSTWNIYVGLRRIVEDKRPTNETKLFLCHFRGDPHHLRRFLMKHRARFFRAFMCHCFGQWKMSRNDKSNAKPTAEKRVS